MRVFVDPDLCISCGDCIEISPEVFDWNEDGLSEAITEPVPEELEASAREALESCPTGAIKEGSPDEAETQEQEGITMRP